MRVPLPTSRAGRSVHLSFWDLACVLTVPILSLYLRGTDVLSNAGWGVIGSYWLLSVAFSLLGFFAFRIQDGMARYFSVHDMLDVTKAVAFTELAICGVLFTLTRLDGIPRSILFIHGLLLATGLVTGRMFTCVIHGHDRSLEYHFRCERIILIGANRFSSFFIKLLNAYAPDQQRIIAVLDEKAEMIGRAISGVRILGDPQQLDDVINEFAIHGIDTERVVVAGEADLLSSEALHEVQRVCEKRQLELSFLPRMLGISAWRQAYPTISGGLEPATDSRPFALPAFFSLKRWIDIVGSLTLIILLLPLLLIASLLVLLDVGPPILFWQQRLGRHGRSFLIYKFRTLRPPFDAAGQPIPEDTRLSAVGQFLRVTRIDELPQLLNVLIGDMSLIGPRPLLPEDQPENTAVRLLVRPGITGWAQVNGAKLVSREAKEKFDEWYIRNASLWVDLKVALMTFQLVLRTADSSDEAKADLEQVQSKNVVAWRPARHDGAERISSMPVRSHVSEQRSAS